MIRDGGRGDESVEWIELDGLNTGADDKREKSVRVPKTKNDLKGRKRIERVRVEHRGLIMCLTLWIPFLICESRSDE